jgi:hypothetical protein
LADQWDRLKERISDHLEQLKDGPQELLRYIGLTPNSKLYGHYLFTRLIPTVKVAAQGILSRLNPSDRTKPKP